MSLILISGSNGSGKSLFAEKLVSQTEGKRFYIATMKPQTEENYRRIEKHRKQREQLCFETLELPYEVAAAPVDGTSVVLLEDVSNLFANAYFERNGSVASVFTDIEMLKRNCKILIAVTISDLEDECYEEETAAYIKRLNQLNRRLFELSDFAFTMKNGQAVQLKGEAYAHS